MNSKAWHYSRSNGATLYIWNNTVPAQYKELDNGANDQNKFSLNGGKTANIDNYIDSSNNVTMLVVQAMKMVKQVNVHAFGQIM